MASSFSTDLKLELMVTGENSGTWGDKTNTNLNLLQQSIAGYQSIALTSTNTTLAMTDATISTARNAVIEFTGTIAANSTVYVASGIEKTYTIKNSTTGAFTLALNQVGGASVIWGTAEKNIKGIYLDGTNANTIDLSTLGGTINSSASLADFVIGPNELDTSSVTSVKIASSAVTSTKIASFAVTSGALDTASVTSVKIASAAVGTTQLIATGVTAATYTAATITVSADGRITSASSGSGGAGMGIPVIALKGPASGTYTANPAANRIGAYILGGGGGFGYAYNMDMVATYNGGDGGWGFWNVPIAQPYSKAYTVGAAGNNPNTIPAPGGAGGATNLTNVGTANGGNSGMVGGTGNNGTAPGSSLAPDSKNFITGGFYGQGAEVALSTGMQLNGKTPGAGFLAIFENTGT